MDLSRKPASWRTIAAGLAAGATAIGTVAHADDYGYYNSNNDLLWGLIHMPDFDQVRAPASGIPGLPGDGGAHCVPTSTMNVLAYIARHGYPNLEPGVSSWGGSSQAVYNDATDNLELLGTLMNTSSTNGTNSGGWAQGTFFWLAANGVLFHFDHYTRLANQSQAVTTRRIAKTGLNGGIVMACFGRWDHDGLVLTNRASGHCITPVRIQMMGSTASELRYRDPATGGASETTQSTFATTTMNMVDEVFFAYGVPMVLSRMNIQPAPSDGRWRIIDSYYTIFPKQGLTDIPLTLPKLKLSTPSPLTPDFASEVFIDAIGGQITGLGQAPSRNFWAYVAAGGGAVGPAVYHVDPLSQQVTMVDAIGLAGGMVFGRDERLYVLDRDRIHCYAPNEEDMLVPEVEIPIPAPHTSGGISYNDMTDEIVVLSVGSRSVLKFQSDAPMTPPTVDSLPTTVPLNDLGSVQVHPETGALWLMADGSVHEMAVDPLSGRLIEGDMYTPPAGQQLRCFSFDTSGNLFVNLDGFLTELAQQRTGEFDVVPDSPFAGQQAGNCLSMSLSRNNIDPAIHSDPGWNTNIPAAEAVVGVSTPDCASDWNADGVSDVFDLLAYLDDWFADSIEADLDGNQTIDVFDLLAYLDLWFAGC